MISVVIPNVKNDHLKKCVDSIIRHTDLKELEVIVVLNGAPFESKVYIEGISGNFPISYVWFDEMAGYPRAVNAGIKKASGDYIVLLNDDILLLDQPKNSWLGMLQEPFISDPTVGITGPIAQEDSFAVFFCVMISRKCLDDVGLLDENFGIGAGEDADFCIRARQKGWKILQVPKIGTLHQDKGLCVGGFPIYHQGEGTVHDRTYVKNWVENCNKNCDYLTKKHGKTTLWRKYGLKLNLGCGPKDYHLPGYTNIDKHDKDADLNLDARDLSRFKDDSVDEIYAGHLVEHFNPYKLDEILKEWKRVLKPGGKLVLELPDIYECCKAIVDCVDKKNGREWEYLACVYGAFFEKDMNHLYGYTFETISAHLWNVGFKNMVKKPQQVWHQGCNMRVECVK